MSREVRRVPADWKHPQDGRYHDGSIRYVGLMGGDFAERLAEYEAEKAKWERGEFPDYASEESKLSSFEEWEGEAPKAEDYMPQWPESEKTHLMMYETCSEGSPIGPAFLTPEELANWLFENKASAFGHETAGYEAWLRIAKGGYAPSMVFTPERGIQSGVEAFSSDPAA